MMTLGERLRYARNRASLTLAQVAQRTDVGESSLSEFEHSKREPSLSQLQMLAKAYSRSIAFFLSEGEFPREVVLWRERPREAAGEIEAKFLRLCEQYHNLEMWCEQRTAVRLPQAEGDVEGFGYAQAEVLAKRVRDELQLGDRPGQVLLRVLEEVCGVKVFHLPFEPTGTAASTMSETFGAAILLNSDNVRWRRNFDAAHELFHLLTWSIFRPASVPDASGIEAPKSEEKLAQCFAGNLLMPTDAVRIAIESRTKNDKIAVEALYDVAREFDVSVDALLWRMHFLFSRGPEGGDQTKRDIERAKAYATLFEDRGRGVVETYPGRYHALAVKALRRGEISIGRFAEYLDISRQQAMTYIEQEIADDEEVQVAPA
jgi:Zn-dependent peptidase ImmA (M78 family)/transcriptional regulator with XRE-family HTH domain